MRKIIGYVVFIFILSFSSFSQDLTDEPVADFSEDERLILPEVTTSITGESITAGKDSITDFSEFIHSDENVENILPVLPQIQTQDLQEKELNQSNKQNDKEIFIEGLLGAGYRGYFKGDFTVYKSSGLNPFLLKFIHESTNGYGKNSAGDGFFDSNTFLQGEKTFNLHNASILLNASYNTTRYGMQSLSPVFYDMNTQTLDFVNSYKWTLPHGFAIETNLKAQWYSRYGGIKNSELIDFSIQEKFISLINLNPNFLVSWESENFCFSFDSTYDFYSMLSDYSTDNTLIPENINQLTKLHRGDFSFNGLWRYSKEEKFSLETGFDAGLVVSNSLENYPVIPSFNIFFNSQWKGAKYSRPFSIALNGGIDSYNLIYSELEKDNKFSSLFFIPSETTDLLVDLKSSFPILKNYSFDVGACFRKTLFDNGFWHSDMKSSLLDSGLYLIDEINRTQVLTDLGFSYSKKLLVLSLSYKSNWVYVPGNEFPHSLLFSFAYQGQKGNWGIYFDLEELLGDDCDLVPIFNASGFYRFKDSLRLTLSIDDFIKLVSSQSRYIPNSKYENTNGSVKILFQFFF